jgi:hypothetical protein
MGELKNLQSRALLRNKIRPALSVAAGAPAHSQQTPLAGVLLFAVEFLALKLHRNGSLDWQGCDCDWRKFRDRCRTVRATREQGNEGGRRRQETRQNSGTFCPLLYYLSCMRQLDFYGERYFAK